MPAFQVILTISLASVHWSAVKNTKVLNHPEAWDWPSCRLHFWSIFCWSASLFLGMPVWVLSVIQISFIFLGILQPPPLPCTFDFCGIYQIFTIKSLMIHKVIPAPGLLFRSIRRVPFQGHIKMWLPFVQHSLSQQSNEVEALLPSFFKWGTRGLASLGPDQTQAINPKDQTLDSPNYLVSELCGFVLSS